MDTRTAAPTAWHSATDLHTILAGQHVLRGVSLSVDAGECVGLLGRNGMGKTTLLRTLLGLARARSGHVAIAGRDCTQGRSVGICLGCRVSRMSSSELA